jgi:hypothetical protein
MSHDERHPRRSVWQRCRRVKQSNDEPPAAVALYDTRPIDGSSERTFRRVILFDKKTIDHA